LTITVSAYAGPVEEKLAAQNKLLAMRAARVDAMRKLAERINGLVITSETTVRDFVAGNDRIQSSMMSWLSGMKEVGEPKWTLDGICQVTLEVTIQEIVVELKRLHKEYYKGDKVRYEDIDKVAVNTTEKTLRETGSGAPRPEFESRGTLSKPAAAGEDIMSRRAWAYWQAHCTGRGRLMAERAARLDSLRKLGERINGLRITSETTVKDFVATDDRIRTRMVTFLRGAREVGTRYHNSELIVEVEMEVTVRNLIVNLQRWHKEYYKGNRIAIADIERISARVEDKDVRETGMGVPPEAYLKDLGPQGLTAVAIGNEVMKWPPVFQVTGDAAIDNTAGNVAQAKLMAQRAAELDARRKMAEQLEGLMITSKTSVRDFVAMDDRIRTSMLTFQQGCRRVNGSERMLDDGTVQVTVEIDLEPLWNMVLYYQEKMTLKVN
ncbi:MAG: hypothetical protein K8R91_04640, partial [Phycisphaerae bacterium]|nr:hypothetical protein [Phycisphaerae bacterium]